MPGRGHCPGQVTTLLDATLAPPAALPRAAAVTARFDALFAEHFQFVWRSVRRLGVPDHAADDAAQEVFAVVARRLGSIELGKEKAFLFGTAVRVASDARRSMRRRREAVSDDGLADPIDVGPGADELVEQRRARRMLDRIVAALPDDTRPVFVLFELEGMTMAEIAGCLELAPGTVASRLRRAREVFQEMIADAQARLGGAS
jgi:RNA polymerase sigma-70 factor (ECF subfamily)